MKKSRWTDLHKCKTCWDQNYTGEKIKMDWLALMQNLLGSKLQRWKTQIWLTCTNAKCVEIKITPVKKSRWTDFHKCTICWDQNYTSKKIKLDRLVLMQNLLGSKLHRWKTQVGLTCTNAKLAGIKITTMKNSSWTDLHKCKISWDKNYTGEKIKLDWLALMQNLLGSKLQRWKTQVGLTCTNAKFVGIKITPVKK